MKKIFYLITIISLLFITACSDNKDERNIELENQVITIADSLFQITHDYVPGMLVYVSAPNKNLNLTFSKGTAQIGLVKNLTSELHYRIGSISKTFVTTVLLQLVDEHKISLETKIDAFLPDFPDGNSINMRQLCNMTSGIKDFTEMSEFENLITSQPATPITPNELIQIIDNYPLNFTPGSQVEYSNSNTVILGKIIEIVTGKSLSENIFTRITGRLGLTQTYIPDNSDFKKDYIHGYGDIDGNMIDVSTKYHSSYFGASGQIVSNLQNLNLWIKSLALGILISPEMQNQRLLTNPMPGDINYGMGIMETYGFIGHSGGVPGYMCFAGFNPEKNCTIIIMYNGYSSIAKISLYLHFLQTIDLLYPDLNIEVNKTIKNSALPL